MKKWKNRKDFNFLHLCLVGSGWKGGKVEKWNFFLIDWEEKKMRIENVVCINLFLCPHIKHYNFFFYIILLINIFFFFLLIQIIIKIPRSNGVGAYFWVGLVLNLYKGEKKTLILVSFFIFIFIFIKINSGKLVVVKKKGEKKRMMLNSHALLLLWEWTKGQKKLSEFWTKNANFLLCFLPDLGRFIFGGSGVQFSLHPSLLTKYSSQPFSLIFSSWFFSILPKITQTK